MAGARRRKTSMIIPGLAPRCWKTVNSLSDGWFWAVLLGLLFVIGGSIVF
jgi:hypothetical protein